MAPPFLGDFGYPRKQKKNRQGRKRRGRRQPTFRSNDLRGAYHQETPAQSNIPNQIQPSPTKEWDRYRKGHPDGSTPERILKWSMDNKISPRAESWEEIRITSQKVLLNRMMFKTLLIEMKSWNINRYFILLKEREA
ncbi:hypothetical protein O181_061298 [Austropuccinia psidii MF-1]|uniref:Uncharacterized protein n=1 Tax=Austropuccinia psidii MF-1 TaxID=1389203 RepID=A0A9Q3EHU3_9BASI|nr:hypothetical protein [Austropuccinia psidii MF-1]